MATRVAAAAALLISLSLVPLTAAARPLTPDQQLAAALTAARAASKSSLRHLAKPTPQRVAKAKEDLKRALTELGTATAVSPRAIGALETPSVRNGLRQASLLAKNARDDLVRGRYAAARAKIAKGIALHGAALDDFGVPLRKDFTSFVVNQDLRYVPQFSGYSALTAKVGTYVDEIVIGAANRETANVGERGSTMLVTKQLPITQMTQYMMIEPNGVFMGGWCELEDGLISCALDQPMRSDQRFTIAFGPKLPRGTKLLVKFRATDGRRAYYVLATR
jgi:hypothetical protein